MPFEWRRDGSNLIRLPTAKANELPAEGDTSGLDYF